MHERKQNKRIVEKDETAKPQEDNYTKNDQGQDC